MERWNIKGLLYSVETEPFAQFADPRLSVCDCEWTCCQDQLTKELTVRVTNCDSSPPGMARCIHSLLEANLSDSWEMQDDLNINQS